MTERENFMRMLLHRDPQWIPYGPDCLDMILPNDVVRERPILNGQNGHDWFGCWWVWDEATKGFSPMPNREPVTDITKWREQVKFPDLDAIDWSQAQKTVDRLDRENRVSVFTWESGPWERVHALVGFENALVSICTEPEAVLELIEAITDFKIKLVEKIAKYYAPDIVIVLDDFGYAKAPFMSDEMFRKFIQPFDAKLGAAITEYGMIYCHHSCGAITPLFDAIMEMKPKLILGAFAPYNDTKWIEENYSEDVVIFGGNDCNLWNSPYSTEEQVRAEVRRCVDAQAPYKNLLLDAGPVWPEREAIIRDELAIYGKDYYKRA